ncbi:MAG: DUF2007 domain-containing protein, partial [Terriglobales bacterium]
APERRGALLFAIVPALFEGIKPPVNVGLRDAARQGQGDCRNLLQESFQEDAMPTNASPQADPQPEPNERLIKVFDTEQENEAAVVQGLLESAGIESDLKSIDAVQNAFPGVGGSILLVREEDAPEAQRIIDEYRKLPPLDDETADITG